MTLTPRHHLGVQPLCPEHPLFRNGQHHGNKGHLASNCPRAKTTIQELEKERLLASRATTSIQNHLQIALVRTSERTSDIHAPGQRWQSRKTWALQPAPWPQRTNVFYLNLSEEDDDVHPPQTEGGSLIGCSHLSSRPEATVSVSSSPA